jgi:hypothetical protein
MIAYITVRSIMSRYVAGVGIVLVAFLGGLSVRCNFVLMIVIVRILFPKALIIVEFEYLPIVIV